MAGRFACRGGLRQPPQLPELLKLPPLWDDCPVMGRTHAVSGAAVWLTGAAILTTVHHHLTDTVPDPGLHTTLTGAAICAGFALLPDIDQPGSTVAGSAGPLSDTIARATRAAGRRTYRATGGTYSRDGHRTWTHTGLFAALLAAATTTGTALFGPWAAALLVFAGTTWAVRALASWWVSRPGAAAFGAAAAGCALFTAPSGGGWWWTGVAAGAGCALHLVGDAGTWAGIPLAGPASWAPVRFAARIECGGSWERGVLAALLGLGASGGLLLLLG